MNACIQIANVLQTSFMETMARILIKEFSGSS